MGLGPWAWAQQYGLKTGTMGVGVGLWAQDREPRALCRDCGLRQLKKHTSKLKIKLFQQKTMIVLSTMENTHCACNHFLSYSRGHAFEIPTLRLWFRAHIDNTRLQRLSSIKTLNTARMTKAQKGKLSQTG